MTSRTASGSAARRVSPAWPSPSSIGSWPTRRYEPQYSHFDRADGLAGLPFAYSDSRRAIRAGDGRVWFVTGRGLTLLDPEALLHEASTPPVRIEGVTADHRYLQATPDAVLPPRTSRLEINYTLLNLTSPLKAQFRYRLEGADADWIDAGTSRQAFYMNLPPGDYRFRVLARSRGTTWTEDAAAWAFSIQPVFYQTIWFWTFCLSLLVFAVWVSWRIRMGQVRQRFALLLGERARLSREIHDTLLQGLVGVSLQFDSLSDEFSPGSAGRQRARANEEAGRGVHPRRPPVDLGSAIAAARVPRSRGRASRNRRARGARHARSGCRSR